MPSGNPGQKKKKHDRTFPSSASLRKAGGAGNIFFNIIKYFWSYHPIYLAGFDLTTLKIQSPRRAEVGENRTPPPGWTLLEWRGEHSIFIPRVHGGHSSPPGANFNPGSQSLPLGTRLKSGIRLLKKMVHSSGENIYVVKYWMQDPLRGIPRQGCQMVCFQTKNPNLGKFFRVSDWKMLIYFMAIWNILLIFGIFYDHLVHCVFIWYSFSGFGIMHQEILATLYLEFYENCT
jgi:hypothetical protein